MAKSGWGQAKWKCPTCQTWVAERMSMRCSSCWTASGIVRRVADEVEVEEPVAEVAMEPVAVVSEAVVEAVVAKAKGGCEVCGGLRHYSFKVYRKRIAAGQTQLTPALIAFFEKHGEAL